MREEWPPAASSGRKVAMGVIRSVVKNGKIELEAPNEWPEGTEVLIEPISPMPNRSVSARRIGLIPLRGSPGTLP